MRDLQFDNMHRSTHGLSLTGEGHTFRDYCARMIGTLDELEGDALVKQKLLVPVLEKFVDPRPVPVYAVTAGARHRLPKIKACIDYWADWFGKPAAASSKKR